MNVHPSAAVDAAAHLGRDVSIGPFCVVEAGARIGDGCTLEARSTVKSGVTLGKQNRVSEGVVIGGLPQHAAPPGPPGGVVVGDRNLFRENATVHRAMDADGVTRIGNDCLLMVAAHVAHDCVVEDRVILTNNVMLGGHVTVGERAFVGGGAAVHQHCRIGSIAMIGGMARVVQDVLPFVTIDGGSHSVVGLNKVGLRRAGFSREAIGRVKDAYQIIYRSGLSLDERLAELSERFPDGPAADFEPFLRETVRGFTRERRSPPGGTLRVLGDELDRSSEKPAPARRAG
ncbi:MAG: acyl-ACP--UDP-N-acetylglucosamine O-acyltransferase [Planctomycetota bacterium]